MAGDGEEAAQIVQLTIRCAFQTAEDQTVEAGISWTVRALKEHIQEVHPSHPEVSSQRLIYCGSCLTDNRILKDIFEQSVLVVEGPTVIHLVCPLPQRNPELRRRTNVPSIAVTNQMSQQPGTVPTTAFPTFAVPQPPPFDSTSHDAYSQYYQQYMNYIHAYQTAMMAAMNTPQYGAFPHPVYVQNGPGMPMMPYFVNPANGGQPVNLTAGNNPPIVMNAMNQPPAPGAAQQPQPAQPERGLGGFFEDGLEFIYKGVRVLFLLMAVLLYSSLERFLLVVGIVLVILVTQFRRAQNRRAENEAQQPVNNNNRGEQHGDAAAGDQPRDADGHEEDEVTENVEAPPPPQPGTLQVVLATCYTFVTSFVASLIPENVPVDVN